MISDDLYCFQSGWRRCVLGQVTSEYEESHHLNVALPFLIDFVQLSGGLDSLYQPLLCQPTKGQECIFLSGTTAPWCQMVFSFLSKSKLYIYHTQSRSADHYMQKQFIAKKILIMIQSLFEVI